MRIDRLRDSRESSLALGVSRMPRVGWIASVFLLASEEGAAGPDAVIVAASQRYRVAPALVKAVVWRESAFDGRARGRAGEIGLMQITEPAAMEWAQAAKLRDFRHAELYDPAKNTLAGSWYLRKLIGRYVNTDNPLAYALADYNAGRSNVSALDQRRRRNEQHCLY